MVIMVSVVQVDIYFISIVCGDWFFDFIDVIIRKRLKVNIDKIVDLTKKEKVGFQVNLVYLNKTIVRMSIELSI